ncbi:MAG: two component transcriptional regulator, LuxR family [Verrucomicrobia bacterium]|nr:two component transcriptional regulator, LuxR family [Verrucomicrobiota bacterium]
MTKSKLARSGTDEASRGLSAAMKLKKSPSSSPFTSPAHAAPAADPSKKIRIMLVDDHPLLRRGMRVLIEQRSRFEICGEADNAPEAVDMVRRIKPDLTIVDITLKSTNGIELTKALRAQAPDMRILVVSMHDEEVYAERALRAGAMGYLMKHEAVEMVIIALERILGGDIYVSDRLKEKMLHRFLNHSTEKVVSLAELLSDRELEVLELIGEGYGTRAIAEQLGLSVKTIDSYREHLKLKLNLGTSSELVRYAIQWSKSKTNG